MLKGKRGITLISLIIYVTAMTLLITVIANISKSFYKNVTRFSDTSGIEIQVEKFNTFFLKQINTSKISITNVTETEVLFSDGTKYIFDSTDKTIYCQTEDRNIKTCDGIEDVGFKYNESEKKIELRIFDGKKEKNLYYKNK